MARFDFALHRPSHRRSGLTLVEMLVATGITILMMAAVVNLFATIGVSINDRQALISISGKLRTARQLLSRDLAQVTAELVPPLSPESNSGYFVLTEGPASDSFPSLLTDNNANNGQINWASSLVPKAQGAELQLTDEQVADNTPQLSGLGDYDDVLAFTVQRHDRPFIGKIVRRDGSTIPIESFQAEVIWFCVENPADGSLGEPGLRTLYRRVLLIAPDAPIFDNDGDLSSVSDAEFFARYDLSVRVGPNGRVANRLADLTTRYHRFAHRRSAGAGFGATQPGNGFPHYLDTSVIHNVSSAEAGDSGTSTVGVGFSPLRPFPSDPNNNASAAVPKWQWPPDENGNPTVNRAGEDVVLSDVLAFDVRVFDAQAPVLAPSLIDAQTALEPGDFGWAGLFANGTGVEVGRGAYVDLGYGGQNWSIPSTATGAVGTNAAISQFSMLPHKNWWWSEGTGSAPPVPYRLYDTWSLDYEADGFDQDRDGRADEGTNGIDDGPAFSQGAAGGIDGFGIDDLSERETMPPYSAPLRGVEVTIRLFDRDSKQIREVKVRRSFATE